MTDNEIIKALECRVKDKCPECPYFHGYPCDKCRNMQTDALDLINRQKAEIKKLKDEYRWLDQESDILQADVENLSRMCDEVNAENENLKAENKELQDLMVKYNGDFAKQEAEIEKLTIRLRKAEHQLDDAMKMYNTIKAEAYKEFAELLCKIWQRYEDENISGICVPKWVMFVYKELVGDTDES